MSTISQSGRSKLLPLGIQDFRRIREENCYYVDKTPLIHQLIAGGGYYFLSRPRRFGKSLLLDTLRELFSGNEELFRGLAIHDKWDWRQNHPVVSLSFGGKYNSPAEIEEDILEQLGGIASDAGLERPESIGSGQVRLRSLLRRLHRKTGRQVVVLVDEYDKPILDVVTDQELAKKNRDYLGGFYGIVKDSAAHVRFVFVTGVSMFSKVNLFSGLNNLKDISLDPRYATICGYTEGDIDQVFAPELEGVDREEMRRWYNGYNWLGEERVYNPYDVLHLFDTGEFDSWWFQTGMPTFLYDLMTEREISAVQLDSGAVDRKRLTRFDVGDIDLRSLMFQSGYLTIREKRRIENDTLFVLEYPNLEVRKNFNSGFLAHMGQNEAHASKDGNALLEHLRRNDFDGFSGLLHAVYAGIPHRWYTNNALAGYEGHYLSILYMHLNAAGTDVVAEESTVRGQSDLVVCHGEQVFVIEAKVVRKGKEEKTGEILSDAMRQMAERGYADKYRSRAQAVHLLALAFGETERNLIGSNIETV